MNRFIGLLLLSLLFFVTGCRQWIDCDEPISTCSEKMKVIDLTGLDGCGLVLQNMEDERFEPHGSKDFGVELEDGMWVTVDYRIKEDVGSICMVGQIIELTCLQKIDPPASAKE